MIDYFESKIEIIEIKQIVQSLVDLKKRIADGRFDKPFDEYEICKDYFEKIRTLAINQNDEELANAQLVYKYYFLVFCCLAKYFESIFSKEYRKSWDYLQDCIDQIKFVGRFVETNKRRELPQIYDLLNSYEQLYPYKLFFSSEYIIGKSHCSICGKSMQALDCIHRKGMVYWGEVATEIVDEISKFQAVSIVKNPEDKRCVAEPSDDNRSEIEKFAKLDEFMKLQRSPLQTFSITSKIEYRINTKIKRVGRNELCSCGSGLKFKKCCERKYRYKYENNIITLGKTIEFY